MICLINDQGLFTYCNPSYRFHLGYEPEALFGKSALSLAHPDDLQMAKDLLADLISGKETSHTFLIRLMTADHRTRWVEHRVSRFTRSETNEYQFLIVASDITEKKLLEEKTNINEENFRNFFETITDILMIAERDGTVVYANPATYRKLGYTFAEVKDRGIMGLHPPELRSEAEKIFAAMFRREMDTCPLPLIRKDGSLLPVETRIWFGKWNGTDCLFGLCKDLSLEQEALQRFNKIFDNNPALMAVGALDTRAFIDVNASFLNTLGYTREEIIGKTSRELGLIVEPEKLEEVQQLLNQHGSARNIRMKTRTRDGKILTGLFSAEIIESQGRKLFLTVMVDITSMLETKSALQKSEQELKAFLRAIPDLLFIFDHQGTFQDVYVEDDSRLLVPAEQLKGHYISEFFDAKVSAGALEAFQKSIRENVLVTFPYMISLNGKEEYYEARIVPISNQQVLCMVRDVTDEINALRTIKQSELESRQLQELFRNVADNMPDMLWAKDLDKRFLFVNQAICDNLLHAHSTEEPIGKTDMFFAERERNMHPDDKQWHTFGEICRDSDAIVLESGSTGQFDEFGNVRGEFLYLDVVKSPLKDASGRIIGTVGAAREADGEGQSRSATADQIARKGRRTKPGEHHHYQP
jgi:PAS domain S-box-containing protein